MKQKIISIATLLIVAATITVSHAQSGMRYPYIQNGNIIVSRDLRGGAKAEYLRPANTPRPERHNEKDTYNRVPAKFEVAGTDESTLLSLSDLPTACSHRGEGWRVPTQRELMLIYALNDKLTPKMKAESYWSETIYAQNSSNGWVVTFVSSAIDTYIVLGANDSRRSVRCVRTIE